MAIGFLLGLLAAAFHGYFWPGIAATLITIVFFIVFVGFPQDGDRTVALFEFLSIVATRTISFAIGLGAHALIKHITQALAS
jgi:hypothetical protein